MKELNLFELKVAVFDKVQEAWESSESFDNDSVIAMFSDALKEDGLELDEDAWSDAFDACRANLENPFYVPPADDCLEETEVDPTPEQHAAATDAAEYLNSMFAGGCLVSEEVLTDYLSENYADEDAETLTALVQI